MHFNFVLPIYLVVCSLTKIPRTEKVSPSSNVHVHISLVTFTQSSPTSNVWDLEYSPRFKARKNKITAKDLNKIFRPDVRI